MLAASSAAAAVRWDASLPRATTLSILHGQFVKIRTQAVQNKYLCRRASTNCNRDWWGPCCSSLHVMYSKYSCELIVQSWQASRTWGNVAAAASNMQVRLRWCSLNWLSRHKITWHRWKLISIGINYRRLLFSSAVGGWTTHVQGTRAECTAIHDL